MDDGGKQQESLKATRPFYPDGRGEERTDQMICGSVILSKLEPDNNSVNDNKRKTFAVISDDTRPESSAIKYI